MGKRSFEYAEGVHVYQHRVRVDEDGDPLILVADARTQQVIDPETGRPKIDKISGQEVLAKANEYGFELHKQLSQEPQTWEELTAAPLSAPESRAPRASIRKRSTPKEQAPDPGPATDGAAEQEPAEK